MPLYNQTIEQSLAELGSDHYSGLSEQQVAERLAKYGPNKLAEGKRAGPLKIFFDQFKNIMVLVLLIAAGNCAQSAISASVSCVMCTAIRSGPTRPWPP